jgi:formamidopyrimidine-DNA glycosylase
LKNQVSEGLGPDALKNPLDAAGLRKALTGRRAVKVALMDQALLAGVGNIHAAEALWRARVNPRIRCVDLSDAALQALAVAIPAQLQEAIVAEDGEEITYVEERGASNPFVVYGHAEAPCPRCQTPITEARLSGRSTFWCPQCQPAG